MLEKNSLTSHESQLQGQDETIPPQNDQEPINIVMQRDVHSGWQIARIGLQVVLMLAVLAGSYMFMNRLIDSRPEPKKRPFSPTTYTVDTMTAKFADHRPDILLYGQVETARQIDLRAPVAGDIITVRSELSAGARIGKGETLLQIDPFNYEGAVLEAKANLLQTDSTIAEIEARLLSERDQLTAAEEQLQFAKDDLARAQTLAQSGTLTQKQVDDRALIVSQRQSSVSQRRNNIAIAEAQRAQQEANRQRLEWRLQEAERRLTDTELKAPFSGIISSANAEPGRSVSTNDVVASLYDDTALEAKFTLTNAQYGRMATDSDPLIGRAVEIVWTVGESQFEYDGQIDRIGATVASERGGVEVVARIETTDHSVQIRPGAFIEIRVPDKLYQDSLRIPETSIYDGNRIFLVQDNQLTSRSIDVLAFDGNFAIIGANNVSDGDDIMITRLTEASEGTPVKSPNDGTSSETNSPRQNGANGQNRNGQRGQNPNRTSNVTRGVGG